MIKVIKKGLETSVQDYPGRIGTLNQGFPPSGPMDSWSFRLANVLVQNDPGSPAFECQFMGPTLKFEKDTVKIGVNNTKFRSQAQAVGRITSTLQRFTTCLLYTSPSPRD